MNYFTIWPVCGTKIKEISSAKLHVTSKKPPDKRTFTEPNKEQIFWIIDVFGN